MIEPAILFGGQRNICDQWNDTSFLHFSFLEEIFRRGEMRSDCSWNILANSTVYLVMATVGRTSKIDIDFE
jgi:hypothetical protein